MELEELRYIDERNRKTFNNKIRYASYVDIIVASGCEMFEHNYDQEVVTANQKEIEKSLMLYGSVIFLKKDGKIYAYPCSTGGEFGDDNRHTLAFPIVRNKRGTGFEKGKQHRVGKDCVVMYNSSSLAPELNITRYADILSEIDMSYLMLVNNSKFYPMPIASDEQQAKVINGALKRMQKGELKTIINQNLLKDLMNGIGMGDNSTGIDILNLTDPSKIQYAQALGMLHNDIISRLYTVNGQAMNGSPKMAQQTVDEVTANHTNSMIYPNNKLFERQLAADKIKELFNVDYSVDFGELWQYSVKENEDYGNNIELGGAENEQNNVE